MVSQHAIAEGVRAAATRRMLTAPSMFLFLLALLTQLVAFWLGKPGWPVVWVLAPLAWVAFEGVMMARAFVDVVRYCGAVERAEDAPERLWVRGVFAGQFPSVARFTSVREAEEAVWAAWRRVRRGWLGARGLVLGLVLTCVVALIVTPVVQSVLTNKAYDAIREPLLGAYVAAFFGVVGVWRWAQNGRIEHALRQSDTESCPKCGYDLTGLDELACPECGWNQR